MKRNIIMSCNKFFFFLALPQEALYESHDDGIPGTSLAIAFPQSSHGTTSMGDN